MLKVLFGIAIVGHLLCGYCDCIPVYIVLTPLRIGGTVNWSAAIMFAGFLLML